MPDKVPRTIVAAYIPVLHKGYIEFLKKHSEAEVVYVFGPDLLKEMDYLRKELRALPPAMIVELLAKSGLAKNVVLLTKSALKTLSRDQSVTWQLPDEDFSHYIAETYLPDAALEFSPVFLRWDRRNVQGVDANVAGVATTVKQSDIAFMNQAYAATTQSSDIWRRVGGVSVNTQGQVLAIAGNRPTSTQNTPWAEGDPRGIFNRGVGIEMSTFIHAEAALVAQAAKHGYSLENTALYVTTFPCPACAMLLSQSGITKLYFSEGYAVLDGRRAMEDSGVSIIRVIMDPPTMNPAEAVPYPEK